MRPDTLLFRQLFDSESSTYTYLIADAVSGEAVLIDTVKEKHERDLQLVKELGLQLKYVLETHVHADHITGAALLRNATGAKVGVSANAGSTCADLQINDGDQIKFGSYELFAIHTPGHTNTCLSYYCPKGEFVFTGDVLFVREVGRTDFQNGSPEEMYNSIMGKLFHLPPETAVYPGHDYKGLTSSTIGEEKLLNRYIGGKNSKADFLKNVAGMQLAQPKKIHVAVPANMRCGQEE